MQLLYPDEKRLRECLGQLSDVVWWIGPCFGSDFSLSALLCTSCSLLSKPSDTGLALWDTLSSASSTGLGARRRGKDGEQTLADRDILIFKKNETLKLINKFVFKK